MNNLLDTYNNYGRFNKAGDEYEILNIDTPVPWSNVLANKRFGTIISTHGTVYSFYKNASEFKLTNWCNDWAKFVPGETYKGVFDSSYNMTYGFGYVKILGENNNIVRGMNIFVPMEDDLKVQYLTITNNRLLDKEVVIEYEPDMVMGVAKELSSKYVLCREENDTLLFKNPYNEYFNNVIAYLKAYVFEPTDSDKIEYSVEENSVRIKCIVKANQTRKLAIVFGATDQGMDTIKNVTDKYSNEENIHKEYDNTVAYWRNKVIKNFKTGNKKLDILANGWLLYQTIACRLFARTSLYQAGGAYGYRDQLQDSLALIKTWPEFTREQILKHASKQFEKGDVLHWWHEHNGRGIRTLFSDDYLWLPYVLSEYIQQTGDDKILDVKIPFLEDKPLEDGRERYDLFLPTETEGTLYEHALRAIKYGLSRKGRQGLLEIGHGDWNDGFSNINGESVWLSFFMMDILERFAKIADLKMDEINKMHFMSQRHYLRHTIFDTSFDGEYFTRAFYPDGTPIGSKESEDCKIDLISQAWSAIALKGYADSKGEIKSALESADKYLVDRQNMIVKLLYPPFNNPKKDPGYIKAYLPGVRENGGQYTHAAIWLAKAYFDIGETKKGIEILDIINPINHADTKEKIDVYKVEPYVVAADVYANEEHLGRGGWTWYTGSSAWLYKVIEDNFKEEKIKEKKEKKVKEPTETKLKEKVATKTQSKTKPKSEQKKTK